MVKSPINLSLGNGNEMTWDDYLAEYDGREVPQNNLTGWIPHEFNFDQYICPADKSEESNRHKRSYAITLGAADSTRTSKRGIAAATGSGWSMNIMRINFPQRYYCHSRTSRQIQFPGLQWWGGHQKQCDAK